MLARTVCAALSLVTQALVSFLLVLAAFYRLNLLERLTSRLQVEQSELVRSDALFVGISRLSLGLSLVTAILFLLWLHRARSNLLAFRSPPLEYSVGEAVWSFFIPVLNLGRPFLVMRDTWRQSDPSVPPFAETFDTKVSASVLITIWWFFFLARGVLSIAATRAIIPLDKLAALVRSTHLQQAMHACSVIAAVAGALCVILIQRRQDALAMQLPARAGDG